MKQYDEFIFRRSTRQPEYPQTSFGDIEYDAYVNVEIFGLDGEEDRAVDEERVRITSRVTIHLRDRVEALFALDGHLAIALVTLCRRTEEVVDAQRALWTQKSRFFKTHGQANMPNHKILCAHLKTASKFHRMVISHRNKSQRSSRNLTALRTHHNQWHCTHLKLPAGGDSGIGVLTSRRLCIVFAVAVLSLVLVTGVAVAVALTAIM